MPRPPALEPIDTDPEPLAGTLPLLGSDGVDRQVCPPVVGRPGSDGVGRLGNPVVGNPGSPVVGNAGRLVVGRPGSDGADGVDGVVVTAVDELLDGLGVAPVAG